MENDNFMYKSHCELSIISNTFDPDLITNEIGINPDRFFKKGEISKSKHSASKITKPHNLWAIKSEITELKEESISHHIRFFKSVLTGKLEIISKYKFDSEITVRFWIWIETNNAGIGFELSTDEIQFINNISNSIHFSLITNDSDE